MTVSVQQDALLGKFSVLAYQDETTVIATLQKDTENGGPLAGWKILNGQQNGAFAAYAFQNTLTGEVAIAYRGTDGVRDVSADLAIKNGTWDTQFQQGLDFAASVKEQVRTLTL